MLNLGYFLNHSFKKNAIDLEKQFSEDLQADVIPLKITKDGVELPDKLKGPDYIREHFINKHLDPKHLPRIQAELSKTELCLASQLGGGSFQRSLNSLYLVISLLVWISAICLLLTIFEFGLITLDFFEHKVWGRQEFNVILLYLGLIGCSGGTILFFLLRKVICRWVLIILQEKLLLRERLMRAALLEFVMIFLHPNDLDLEVGQFGAFLVVRRYYSLEKVGRRKTGRVSDLGMEDESVFEEEEDSYVSLAALEDLAGEGPGLEEDP